MLEYLQTVLIKSVLDTGLAARSITATVKQANQPRQAGTLSTPEITFFHVASVNVGWPEKKDEYDEAHSKMVHSEIQNRESRWQIGAIVPRGPNSTLMPSDYLLACAGIMQSNATLDTLTAKSVGIQHITQIRSVWFVDDKGQNSESPSFDIILSHQDVVISETPVLNAVKFQIEEV